MESQKEKSSEPRRMTTEKVEGGAPAPGPSGSVSRRRGQPGVAEAILNPEISDNDAWELLQEAELEMLTTLEKLVS